MSFNCTMYANFMQIFKVYAIYGNSDEKFLYKRKPFDHVVLKQKNYIQVTSI